MYGGRPRGRSRQLLRTAHGTNTGLTGRAEEELFHPQGGRAGSCEEVVLRAREIAKDL